MKVTVDTGKKCDALGDLYGIFLRISIMQRTEDYMLN